MICSRCKKEKEIDQFNNWSRSKNGKQKSCRDCCKQVRLSRGYDEKRRARPDYKQYNDARNRKYVRSIKGRSNYLYIAAKKRAIEKNLPFNITVEFIQYFLLIGVCPKTGFEFDLNTKGRSIRNMFAPSVDRVDNDKGYTFDNVQVVCDMYNHGKGQHSDEDFIKFCHRVALMNPLKE